MIPAYECGDDREAVGIGLGSEPTFQQPRYLVYVALTCDRDGVAQTETRVYVRGMHDEMPASVGDEVRVSTRHGDHKWQWVKARNLTTGEELRLGGRPYPDESDEDVDFGAFPLFSPCASPGGTCYPEASGFGDVEPVPHFGRLRVEHARIAGTDAAAVSIGSTDPGTPHPRRRDDRGARDRHHSRPRLPLPAAVEERLTSLQRRVRHDARPLD